jgi:uncharacterized peroxidase-related enzyme
MSIFKSIEPSETTGQTKQMFDGLQRKLGMVPNLAKQLANSPVSLKAYLSWGAALSEGVLPAQLREQIAMAVANANGCDYCLSVHTALGSLAGLTREELLSAQQGDATDRRSGLAIQFALKVVEKRGHVPADEIDRLRSSGLADAEIIEIVAVVAVNLFTNYFNHIAEAEIDFPLVHATIPSMAH